MFQLFKAVPLTWLMLFVSGLLWAADNELSRRLNIDYGAAQQVLGAMSSFALWSGAWWRVFTTAFHQGDVIHLLCNTACLWWLGRLLETRLGTWRYAVFCVAAIAVSGVAQMLWNPYVGLSGMLYAQFGLIWAWRRTDAWLQEYVRNEHIQWGLIWLFLGLILTWFQILRVGNVAHFSGCIYGYLTAAVYCGGARARSWRPVFLAAHAFLIPGFYFVMHPFWNGVYHWRQGDLARDPEERRQHFQNAIYWDPDLNGPWVHLAQLSAQQGRLQEAWTWILRGLKQHPTYQEAIELARELWTHFPNRLEREAARLQLRQMFGDEAPQWEQTLLTEIPLDEIAPRIRVRKPSSKAAVEEAEPPHVTLPPFTLPRRALDEIPHPGMKLPAPDPNTPGSAEEGRST